MNDNVAMALVFLFLGSYSILDNKWMFQTCVPTLNRHNGGYCPHGERQFDKPWGQNLFQFMGEFLLLFVYYGDLIWKKKLNSRRERRGPKFTIFAIPAFCDVMGSGLMGVAMVVLDAAVVRF